jgi:symplekin
VWLNEEWYNGKLGRPAQYTANLDAVIASFLPKVDARDKALGAFLTTLPEIPTSVINVLESLCVDVERSIVGFLALRELVETRPPVRAQSLDILLQLCTHADIKLRVMAISTVKRWVPGSPMSAEVIGYGLQVLRRLTSPGEKEKPVEGEAAGEGADVKMEEATTEEEKKPDVNSRFLEEVSPETVRQHVELIFALSRRQQDLLEHIFLAYIDMRPEIQDALESLLTPLIQSLGPTRELLDQLRRFPPGAEKLALKVLYILSGAGSSPVLVNVVKTLMAERDLNPKFVIPIIGQLDKVSCISRRMTTVLIVQTEIEKQISKIVALLGEGDSRELVRTTFASILQKMTPAELMVALHTEETSLKPTIEGELNTLPWRGEADQ